jgi:nucleotide-binding universal stress UspA family protein
VDLDALASPLLVVDVAGAIRDHGLGFIIAAGYVGIITSILWWMLHVPKVGDVGQHVSRVTREAGRFQRIVVPIQGDVFSGRLVALASQMARFRGARMDVIYIVEVPLQFPIDAVSEEQKRQADEAFLRAEKIAAQYDVRINKHLHRARQAGPSIVQYVRDTNADLLLMGDAPKLNHRGTRYARSVEYVFENAPCEVIIDRPPMDGQ